MTRSVGIEREGSRLDDAATDIAFWGRYVMDKTFDKPYDWESQNMLTIARLITTAAKHRTESRGVHYRTDYPNTDNERWQIHVTLRRRDDGPALDTQPVDAPPA